MPLQPARLTRILSAVTQDSAPAGWYDDPAGSGGRRYWNGSTWTDRVQQGGAARRPSTPAARTTNRERVPDGHIRLNGQHVPLDQTSLPSTSRRISRGPVVGVVVAIGIALLLTVSSVFATDGVVDLGDWSGANGDLYMVEVDSRYGTGVDVIWSDGADTFQDVSVDPGWSTDIDTNNGPVEVWASANDGQDLATCRIIDAEGDVLVETTAVTPGGTATCRWED